MSSQSDVYLRFVKLTEDVLTPTREPPKSAGFDLRSPCDAIVPARGKELIYRLTNSTVRGMLWKNRT
jgi:dUTPase